ncbi:prephenate/arogenate dehydrogenase [Gloeocapsopsis dulcis]|uniref:Arogenate dehydrogenase n=1 Tax=Gloeocapsopsis dulcis AAB1 = 1H9 TaxID=1433147 RepID=A0A6N8FRU4_9CHRO|nr:prephenate/arogenate dehydrogenase [Gloeocapsopsis dulcis]MUL35850.1 arogenate dehydrogenase [Gloeocapsopsis dulcis AAB1 = 1H9]WNN87684.1 prephenate/arogenate dehydrogenase [Gloeocapsopsis dulcis]
MNIGIVGLGLIGGSLGLDLRLQGYRVLGVSRREQTCEQAIACGAVDTASVDLATLKGADVVIICTHIAAILPTVQQLIPHLAPATVLTDVGSVKVPVVEAIAPLWENFVGGHPMAGKTESGLEASQKELFVNKPYVLTPIASTPASAVQIVEEVARSLQAKIYYCPPEDHDRAVSWISHLPVMVSSNLIAACMSESNPEVLTLAQNLASSGFRDTSRVGGGNSELGVMMARYNRQELLRSLQQYRQHLDGLMAMIEQENWEALEQQLKSTHAARPRFLKE